MNIIDYQTMKKFQRRTDWKKVINVTEDVILCALVLAMWFRLLNLW